jgi:GDP-L-fucose synthase
MDVLVTGATGFLGTALTRRLEADGDNVVAVGSKLADLTQPDALESWADAKFDRIFHLAAWTQAGDFCLRHPGEQWVINQRINTTVLGFWQAHQPRAKLISMGTSCSYDPELELVEENYLAGTPIDSLFTYAHTKRMLYIGQLALRRQFGLDYLTVVPSTLYGPGYHTDGRQMHFIFDLIRKIVRGRLFDEPVVLWGDGYQSRELVFLHDFIDVLLRLVDTVDNEIINIGAGEEHTIREFAGLICGIVGYEPNRILYDTEQYVGARSKELRIEKLRSLIPDLAFTPLEIGLAQTIEWFWSEQEALVPERT